MVTTGGGYAERQHVQFDNYAGKEDEVELACLGSLETSDKMDLFLPVAASNSVVGKTRAKQLLVQ